MQRGWGFSPCKRRRMSLYAAAWHNRRRGGGGTGAHLRPTPVQVVRDSKPHFHMEERTWGFNFPYQLATTRQGDHAGLSAVATTQLQVRWVGWNGGGHQRDSGDVGYWALTCTPTGSLWGTRGKMFSIPSPFIALNFGASAQTHCNEAGSSSI